MIFDKRKVFLLAKFIDYLRYISQIIERLPHRFTLGVTPGDLWTECQVASLGKRLNFDS